MFLREEQRIRNAQVVGSSPTISPKTCVNTSFSQVFSFSEMHFKTHYAIKNLTLFYRVRFCFFRFSAQDHLLTIYNLMHFRRVDFPLCLQHFLAWNPLRFYSLLSAFGNSNITTSLFQQPDNYLFDFSSIHSLSCSF